MGELFNTLKTIVLGLGTLGVALVVLYGLTLKLPRILRNACLQRTTRFPKNKLR